MKKYTVKTPIQFNGKGFEVGDTIELDDKHAVQLLELDAIVEIAAPTQNNVPEGEEKLAAIKAAIESLDAENKELFTSSGKAKTEAIAAITGWPVSAAERDAAAALITPGASAASSPVGSDSQAAQ